MAASLAFPKKSAVLEPAQSTLDLVLSRRDSNLTVVGRSTKADIFDVVAT
jgi:hypothetical protein